MTGPVHAGGLVSAAAQGLVASAIRTYIPIVFAWLFTGLGLIHFTVDDATQQTAVNAATVALIAFVWHLIGQLAERVGSSKLGWFFHGFAAAPSYATGNPYVASAVRTFVPYAAGAVVVWLAHLRIDFDNTSAEALITGLISGAISMAWYLIARLGESFGSSKWGLLLGFLRPPSYTVDVELPALLPVIVDAEPGEVVELEAGPLVAVIGGRHAAKE